MLLQTNRYLVPPAKLERHAELVGRFAPVMRRLGCATFGVWEELGPEWAEPEQGPRRFVQMMGFRDRAHQRAVRAAEAADPEAQELIAAFCRLVDYPRQAAQGETRAGCYRHAVGSVGAVAGADRGDVNPHA